jgi:hypothetical protein
LRIGIRSLAGHGSGGPPCGKRCETVKAQLVIGFLLLPVVACSSSSSPSTADNSPTGANANTPICQHANGALNDSLNTMSEGAARDIEPSIAALQAAARLFQEDAKSGDPQVVQLARLAIAGIQQEIEHIRSAGTLAIIDQEGLASKFTDATIALGNYCG